MEASSGCKKKGKKYQSKTKELQLDKNKILGMIMTWNNWAGVSEIKMMKMVQHKWIYNIFERQRWKGFCPKIKSHEDLDDAGEALILRH